MSGSNSYECLGFSLISPLMPSFMRAVICNRYLGRSVALTQSRGIPLLRANPSQPFPLLFNVLPNVLCFNKLISLRASEASRFHCIYRNVNLKGFHFQKGLPPMSDV